MSASDIDAFLGVSRHSSHRLGAQSSGVCSTPRRGHRRTFHATDWDSDLRKDTGVTSGRTRTPWVLTKGHGGHPRIWRNKAASAEVLAELRSEENMWQFSTWCHIKLVVPSHEVTPMCVNPKKRLHTERRQEWCLHLRDLDVSICAKCGHKVVHWLVHWEPQVQTSHVQAQTNHTNITWC